MNRTTANASCHRSTVISIFTIWAGVSFLFMIWPLWAICMRFRPRYAQVASLSVPRRPVLIQAAALLFQGAAGTYHNPLTTPSASGMVQWHLHKIGSVCASPLASRAYGSAAGNFGLRNGPTKAPCTTSSSEQCRGRHSSEKACLNARSHDLGQPHHSSRQAIVEIPHEPLHLLEVFRVINRFAKSFLNVVPYLYPVIQLL
jgi:hypothetical protein